MSSLKVKMVEGFKRPNWCKVLASLVGGRFLKINESLKRLIKAILWIEGLKNITSQSCQHKYDLCIMHFDLKAQHFSLLFPSIKTYILDSLLNIYSC